MSNIYNIDYNKLAVLLLPTFLRKPIILAFAHSLLSPLNNLHSRFINFQKEKEYRLKHNGQVCYLTAALNDRLDYTNRRITITDNIVDGTKIVLYMREEYKHLLITLRCNGATVINRRGYSGAGGLDFWINIPAEVYGNINESLIKSITNTYKLVSKRFAINYK